TVTEYPYVRAFDPEGRLVYLEPLERTERPTALIPATLPSNPLVAPEPPPYNDDCRGINGLLHGHIRAGVVVPLAIVGTILGVFLAGALVASFITLRFFWDFYARRRPGK
ncbi:MAG TPA: hypothetical protein VLS25_00870, partial [Dehalococcoidia bacterium]|nr:hypothetical protein [Dehalococcoidia bacterium]